MLPRVVAVTTTAFPTLAKETIQSPSSRPGPKRGSLVKTDEFRCLGASVDSSLFRNGKVFSRRDGSSNDGVWKLANIEIRSMPVCDARSREREKHTALGVNGFELVEEPLGCAGIGCLVGREVVRHSYPHIMWRPSITMSGPSPATGSGQQVQPPLHMVHGDCTLTGNDAYHFMFQMIAFHHPALCDAASAHPDDLAVFEVRHADRTSDEARLFKQ